MDFQSIVVYLTKIPASWIGAISDAAGDVIVDAVDESGNEYNLGSVGTAETSRVKKLHQLISQKLADKGFTAGKLAIRIRVDNPGIVSLYANYNAGDLRGHVDVECLD
jgi:hypothetical protein